MKIAICDDREEDILIARKELQQVIYRLHTIPEIYEFTQGNTMVEEILTHGIEVVLLDIDINLCEKFSLNYS